MTSVINIALGILFTYRLSRLIVGEMGPFNLFDKIRSFIMSRYDSDHWLYNGIGCPLCVSFWIAIIAAIYTTPDLIHFPLHWLGIAGAVTLIYRTVE